MNIDDAINSLRPNSQWILRGETYENIEWLDENQTKPSKKEINEELKRLKDIDKKTEYKNKRQMEYPSIESQLDTLFHGGYDAWKEQIQAIKDKYPKPE